MVGGGSRDAKEWEYARRWLLGTQRFCLDAVSSVIEGAAADYAMSAMVSGRFVMQSSGGLQSGGRADSQQPGSRSGVGSGFGERW